MTKSCQVVHINLLARELAGNRVAGSLRRIKRGRHEEAFLFENAFAASRLNNQSAGRFGDEQGFKPRVIPGQAVMLAQADLNVVPTRRQGRNSKVEIRRRARGERRDQFGR